MSKLHSTMRTYHRYLGFFLSGIMAVYALSGIVLIFRETDFLKSEQTIERSFPSDFEVEQLGKALKIRDFKIEKEENDIIYFKEGSFNKKTGVAVYTKKELPFVLKKMTQLHKATTNDPLYFLNIFFGTALLFFVVSSFLMFMPQTSIFKKGLYFALAGIVLTLVLIFI